MSNRPIRVLNKYVTNPLLRVFTHAPFGPFAVLHHTGRRSGKPYETTIMVWRLDESFVIALTYGTSVDWYRNIQASDHSTLFWQRNSYTVGKPTPISAETALPAFPLFLRPILQRRVQHFVQLAFIKPDSSGEAALSE